MALSTPRAYSIMGEEKCSAEFMATDPGAEDGEGSRFLLTFFFILFGLGGFSSKTMGPASSASMAESSRAEDSWGFRDLAELCLSEPDFLCRRKGFGKQRIKQKRNEQICCRLAAKREKKKRIVILPSCSWIFHSASQQVRHLQLAILHFQVLLSITIHQHIPALPCFPSSFSVDL